MKQKSIKNGSNDDHWATPEYILDWMRENYGEFFDPCPLHANFDGLSIDWKDINYINPPYNRFDKPKFIKKAYEESLKGKLCIMLIPADTDTKIFHNIIVPNAEIRLLNGRIKFKGWNTKGEYVTNKTGQSGSMIVIFGKPSKIISWSVPNDR